MYFFLYIFLHRHPYGTQRIDALWKQFRDNVNSWTDAYLCQINLCNRWHEYNMESWAPKQELHSDIIHLYGTELDNCMGPNGSECKKKNVLCITTYLLISAVWVRLVNHLSAWQGNSIWQIYALRIPRTVSGVLQVTVFPSPLLLFNY